MNRFISRISLTVILFAVTVSCADHRKEERVPVKVHHSLTVTLEPGKWIYYSINDSCVVGKSVIGNAQDDEEWKNRSDWDIALSESGIRTNGGSSGCGKGGLAVISEYCFESSGMETLSSLQYTADTVGVCSVIPLDI